MSEDITGTATPGRPKRSDSIAKLALALSKAQGQMENADKDGRGTYGKYATLASTWDVIRKPLADNEIAIYQRIIRSGQRMTMATMLIHSSGEFLDDCELDLIFDNNNRMTAMQAMGSAVTYARRYTLQSVTGVAPQDDDDGAAAGKPQETQKSQSKPTQGQNSQPAKNQTSSKPASKPEPSKAPPVEPPKITPPPEKFATDDDWVRMDEVLMATGLTQKDFRDWVTVIHSLPADGKVPVKFIDEFMGYANAEGFSADDFRRFVADQKSAPKPKAGPKEGEYVMPVGKGVKDKKLSELSDKTLAEIVVWADKEMAKTPKPKNLGQLFEIKTNVTAYIRAKGV